MTVATWNVANLFDTVDSSYSDEVLSPREFTEKLQRIASVLDALEADVVALQEVENAECLRQLNSRLKRPYTELGLLEGNDNQRGIDVAFLSRIPVASVVSHRDRDLPDKHGVSPNYRFSRDCLEVTLRTDPPVVLLINHFKSSRGGRKPAAAKRRVQAEAVAELVGEREQRQPEAIVVVLGDLNDEPDSWSLEPLMAKVLDPMAGWPESLRGTHRSRRGRSSLDHIFVSAQGQGRWHEPKVWRDAGQATSDHDPVTLRLLLDDVGGQSAPRDWSSSDPSAQGS